MTSSASPIDHRVAMLERLLRHEARMHAAHDHGHAPGAKRVGDLVAAVDVARHGGDADEVGLEIEVDRLDVLVGQHHFVASRGMQAATASKPARGE